MKGGLHGPANTPLFRPDAHRGQTKFTVPPVVVGIPPGGLTGQVLVKTAEGVYAWADCCPLTVTINVATIQDDPTKYPIAAFDIHFSEEVTGLVAADIDVVTSPVYGVVKDLTGSGQDYLFQVKYQNPPDPVDLDGATFTATIPAGVATGTTSGKDNAASTSTDNTVLYDSEFTYRSGFLPTPFSHAFLGFTKIGNHLFITENNNHRLYSIDVSNLSAPSTSQVLSPIPGGSSNAVQPRGVATDGTLLYLASAQQLRVIDVSNPAAMSVLGTTVNDATNLPSGNVCLYDDGYCYVAMGSTADRVTAVDVSTPAAPTVVGSITSSDIVTPKAMAKIGDVVFVLNHGPGGTSAVSAITAVDFSNPAAPSVVGLLTGLPATTQSSQTIIVAIGTNLYIACGSNGLRVVDASDPTDMSVIGSATMPYPAGNFIQTAAFTGVDQWDASTIVLNGGGVLLGHYLYDISTPSTPQFISGSMGLDITSAPRFLADGGATFSVYQNTNGLHISEYTP